MKVKVTVVVLTYNHERFINQALNSILAQRVNFPIQVIVADDGSTDRTNEIVAEFKQNYPEIFIKLGGGQNYGVRQNILNCLSEIKGEFIAILDGDDYWKDETKLSKQVEFLEKNETFDGVFHDTEIVHVDQAQEQLFNSKKYYSQSYVFKQVIDPADVLSRKIILPSSSAVFRSSILGKVDKKLLTDNYSMLWKLTCFGIKSSKFYFMNEPMSVYHNHLKGISKSDHDEFHLSHITFLRKLIDDDFYRFFKYSIYEALAHEYKVLIDSKKSKLNKRKLFRKYVVCEIQKMRYYRQTIKN